MSAKPFFKDSVITAWPIDTSLTPPILISSGRLNKFKSWPALTNRLVELVLLINTDRGFMILKSPFSMLFEKFPVCISIPSTPINLAYSIISIFGLRSLSWSTNKEIFELDDIFLKWLISVFNKASWGPDSQPWSDVICDGESGTSVIWSGCVSLTRFLNPKKFPHSSENGFPSRLKSQ